MSLRFGSGSSGVEDSSTMNEDRTMYSRHTCYQTQLLEAFYREYPQPNDEQLRELSREIGLDVKQIKIWWYHNNPALTKWEILQGEVDRADNSVLREENEKIRYENEALKESLNTILCTACGGPSLTQHQRNSNLEKLLTDNANLKQEYWKLSKAMAKYTGKVHLLSVDSPFTRRTPCCVMNNYDEADGRIFGIPTNCSSTQSVNVMMNNYNNNVHQQDAGMFGILSNSTLAPPLMNNNAAHNQPQGIFGIPSSRSTLATVAPDGLEQVMDQTDNNNAAGPLAELMKLLA